LVFLKQVLGREYVLDKRLQSILADYGAGDEAALIPILQRVQEEMGYVSEDAIFAISDSIDVPPAEVFGVLTFYAQFRLQPVGKHNCRVCRGTACHVRGAPTILTSVRDELGLNEDMDTTSDSLFTLEEIACFGACSLAPVMVLDDRTYGRMTPARARKLIKQVKETEDVH
jgi:NADH-quinone oxidoreductase subunit E